MKNSSDIIGNRTRDLPTCSTVPQPTALPRAPALLRYCLTLYPVAVTGVYRTTVCSAVINVITTIIIIIIVICGFHIRE